MSSKVGPSKQLYSATQQRTKDRVSAGSQPVKKKDSSILRLMKRSLRQVSKGVKTDIREAKKIWLPFPAVLCLFVLALLLRVLLKDHGMSLPPQNVSLSKLL